MNTWQLQDAKAQFSDVIQQTIHHGPQLVTLRGKPSVILISVEEYEQLIRPKKNLVEFLQNSPLKDVSLDIKRSTSKTRDENLFE
ncbi:MAG: type II toxin-antitoxin system Phd/YefM family antitoxin [Pseudomonadota bacterium]